MSKVIEQETRRSEVNEAQELTPEGWNNEKVTFNVAATFEHQEEGVVISTDVTIDGHSQAIEAALVSTMMTDEHFSRVMMAACTEYMERNLGSIMEQMKEGESDEE